MIQSAKIFSPPILFGGFLTKQFSTTRQSNSPPRQKPALTRNPFFSLKLIYPSTPFGWHLQTLFGGVCHKQPAHDLKSPNSPCLIPSAAEGSINVSIAKRYLLTPCKGCLEQPGAGIQLPQYFKSHVYHPSYFSSRVSLPRSALFRSCHHCRATPNPSDIKAPNRSATPFPWRQVHIILLALAIKNVNGTANASTNIHQWPSSNQAKRNSRGTKTPLV